MGIEVISSRKFLPGYSLPAYPFGGINFSALSDNLGRWIKYHGIPSQATQRIEIIEHIPQFLCLAISTDIDDAELEVNESPLSNFHCIGFDGKYQLPGVDHYCLKRAACGRGRTLHGVPIQRQFEYCVTTFVREILESLVL